MLLNPPHRPPTKRELDMRFLCAIWPYLTTIMQSYILRTGSNLQFSINEFENLLDRDTWIGNRIYELNDKYALMSADAGGGKGEVHHDDFKKIIISDPLLLFDLKTRVLNKYKEIGILYGITAEDRIHNPTKDEVVELYKCLKKKWPELNWKTLYLTALGYNPVEVKKFTQKMELELNPQGAQRPFIPGDKSQRPVAHAPVHEEHISGVGGILQKAEKAKAVVKPIAGLPSKAHRGGGRRYNRFLKGYRNYKEDIDGTDRLQDNDPVDD
jgi:hypothetical protein